MKIPNIYNDLCLLVESSDPFVQYHLSQYYDKTWVHLMKQLAAVQLVVQVI